MGRPSAFEEIILSLHQFWADQDCVRLQSLHMEVGTGEGPLHPATFLRSLITT